MASISKPPCQVVDEFLLVCSDSDLYVIQTDDQESQIEIKIWTGLSKGSLIKSYLGGESAVKARATIIASLPARKPKSRISIVPLLALADGMDRSVCLQSAISSAVSKSRFNSRTKIMESVQQTLERVVAGIDEGESTWLIPITWYGSGDWHSMGTPEIPKDRFAPTTRILRTIALDHVAGQANTSKRLSLAHFQSSFASAEARGFGSVSDVTDSVNSPVSPTVSTTTALEQFQPLTAGEASSLLLFRLGGRSKLPLTYMWLDSMVPTPDDSVHFLNE